MANLPVRQLRPHTEFYGISLTETSHRSWENEGETSQLLYHWEEVPIEGKATYTDISIAVAQSHHTEDPAIVKKIANDIYQSERLKVTNSILGIKENQLQKVGVVEAKEKRSDRSTAVTIRWLAEIDHGDLPEPILTDDLDIKQITGRQLNKIERRFPEALTTAYAAMPAPERLIEEELVSKMIDYKTFKELPPKVEPGGKITVFYGTNRNALDIDEGKQQYGHDLDQLHFGFCEVSVPQGHIQGELEYPTRVMGIGHPEHEDLDIVIKQTRETSQGDFLKELKARLAEAPEKQALVFVHGYNTSFDEAARRTGQLGWDLPFDGLTGFFSWPSSGTIPAYLADETRARTSVKAFEEFLSLLLKDESIEQLHIIAHSMGSLVTTLTVNELSKNGAIAGELSKVRQIILGAPDIDKNEFRINILPEFVSVGQRRTVYVSDHDAALKFSQIGRIRLERLGQTGKAIFVANDLDTVDASNIEASSSHSYMFQNKMMLTDIYYLVTQGLEPRRRRLRRIGNAPLPYWLFLQ